MDRITDTIEYLLDSTDETYYCDRHVRPVRAEPSGDVEQACRDAVSMMRAWKAELRDDRSVYSSVPVAIVDEEWLQEKENPASPHVWVWLSKRESALRELDRRNERAVVRTGIPILDSSSTRDSS